MKQTTHENIKQIDISLGGGLMSEKVRIDTINHPILIVGLGGTGTDALLRLKYQINKRFKLPDNPVTKQKKPKPDNIEYLTLETNEHDKKKYKGIGLDPYTEIVLLSNAGIGSILNNRSTMPDYIRQWLAPELTITDGTKGASGNRQAGRLLLFEKINSVIDAIDNKIRTLRTDQENKLLVFILSGLSGGTGGGMFLDVAYIIRGLMERDYGSKGVDKVEITGYLFTPDVHMAGKQLNVHTEEYIQRNGYAALKELDYWMNLEERTGERFHQKYGTRLEVNSPLAPFNLCHLISGSNIDGVFIKGAYDYCMNVTAENIVNFLALEEKESGQEFAIQDYLSNLLSNISTMKSNLPPGMPHAANFSYNIIGASTAILPSEGINSKLAYGLMREMSPMFNALPDEHGLNLFIQATRLDINSLGAELARTLPAIKLNYVGTDYYSFQNVIKTGRIDIDEKLLELYNTSKRELSSRQGQGIINFETVKAELKEVFLNPKQGVFYVSQLISSDKNPNLLSWIETCQHQLREKITQVLDEINALEIAAETRLSDAQKVVFFNKEKKKNLYIETKIKIYQAKLQKDCLVALIDEYKELRNALEAENDNVYAVYKSILTEISRILTHNATFTSPNSQKAYHWNMIDVADTEDKITKMLQATGTDMLIRDFSKAILIDSSRWLNTPAMAFSDFLYERFASFLSQSMSEFLSLGYGSGRIVEHIVEGEIAPRLYRDAKPVFHMDNTTGLFNFPSYGVVTVPWNAPDVLRGIESYQQHALSNLRFNIRKSNITDRIFWLNTQNGIPLFAYAPIRVYEELYEKTIHSKEGIGRHLVMNERESWVNLPSPLPESLWGDSYNNPRQKALNDEARKIMAKGLSYGSIKERAGRFICVTTQDFEPNNYDVDVKADIQNLHNIMAELTSLQQNGLTMVDERVIYGSSTIDEAREHFLRSPKLIALVCKENAKYDKINKLIEDLQGLLAESDKEKGLTDDFLRVLTCEAIVKRGIHYLYDKELEEDPWPPFVNLIDHADYPEYEMFNTYKNLSAHQLETLRKKARIHEEKWQGDKLLINLKKWQGTVAVRKNQLDNDMWKWTEGTKMYVFYRNILLRLNAQVTALNG